MASKWSSLIVRHIQVLCMTTASLSLLITFTTTITTAAGAKTDLCVFGNDADCMFPCRCDGGGSCDPLTGKCYPGGGCGVGGIESDDVDTGGRGGGVRNDGNDQWKWHGPGCQVGNVAMNKRAISNDHSAALGEWVDENAMTDGVTRTSTRTCPVIWTMTSTPAAWLIDLETTHKVNAFKLYVFSRTVGKLRLTVGNTTSLSEHVTCAVLKNNRRIRNLEALLNCSAKNLIGRYVSVVKDPTIDSAADTLELCEIAVIGHPYRTVDWSRCMDSKFNGVWCGNCLDSMAPDCSEKCVAGSYGLNCGSSCEPCDGPCNEHTGICDDKPPSRRRNKNKKTKLEIDIPETTPTTLINQVVFAAHEDDQEETKKDFTVEPDVSSGSNNNKNKNNNSNKKVTTVVETDEIIHSVVQVEVTSNEKNLTATLSPPATKNNPSDNAGDKRDGDPNESAGHERPDCQDGYFGYMCNSLCGSCANGDVCDPEFGTCPNGCVEWYIGGNHDCDTHIPAIDLHIENVAVFPTPHSLKVKLYGVRRVDQKVQGFYKGEIRYHLNTPEANQVIQNDYHHDTNNNVPGDDHSNHGDQVLTFYPENGSFMKELTLSALKDDTPYELTITIYRVHNGQAEAGTKVTVIANTTKQGPVKQVPVKQGTEREASSVATNNNFIILLVACMVLLVCISGIGFYLCVRKKHKSSASSTTSDSETSEDSQDVMGDNNNVLRKDGVLGFLSNKQDPDPIYQFIDDGTDQTQYHVYHDIDELARNRKHLSWGDIPKVSKDDYTGSVSLISRPPFVRTSFTIPEVNELEDLRRSQRNGSAAVNHDYLTTSGVKQGERGGQSNAKFTAPVVPRYVKTSHGSRSRLSVASQDRQSKGECDYLMPVSRANSVVQSPASVRSFPQVVSSPRRNPNTSSNHQYINDANSQHHPYNNDTISRFHDYPSPVSPTQRRDNPPLSPSERFNKVKAFTFTEQEFNEYMSHLPRTNHQPARQIQYPVHNTNPDEDKMLQLSPNDNLPQDRRFEPSDDYMTPVSTRRQLFPTGYIPMDASSNNTSTPIVDNGDSNGRSTEIPPGVAGRRYNRSCANKAPPEPAPAGVRTLLVGGSVEEREGGSVLQGQSPSYVEGDSQA